MPSPPVLRVVTGADGVVRSISGDTAGVFGGGPDDQVGRGLDALLVLPPSVAWAPLWAWMRRSPQAGVPVLCHVVTADGALRPVELRCRRLGGAGADPRYEVELAVPEHPEPVDDRAAQLAWRSPDSLMLIDEEGLVVFANPATEAFWGAAPGSLAGRPFAEVGADPEVVEGWVAAAGRAFAGELVTVTYRLGGDSDDAWYDAFIFPVEAPPGRPARIAVVARDVTRYQRQVDGARAELALVRGLLAASDRPSPRAPLSEEASDGLAVTDTEGRIVEANGAFEALVGARRADLVGTDITDRFAPDDAATMRVHARRLRDDEIDIVGLSAHVVGADGATLAVRASVTARRDATRGFLGCVVRVARAERSVLLADPANREVAVLRNRVAQLERAVHRFRSVLEEVSPGRQAARSSRWWAEGSRLDALSPREFEIVQLLTEGLRPPSISKRLGLSASTIRNHLSAIYRKLSVSSQEDLLRVVRGLEP